jgi:hypothetical protein
MNKGIEERDRGSEWPEAVSRELSAGGAELGAWPDTYLTSRTF